MRRGPGDEASTRLLGRRNSRFTRAAVLFGVFSLACTKPAPEPAVLQRSFVAHDPTWVEVNSRGRWAAEIDLPGSLSESVDLPPAARAVLPWTILGEIDEDRPDRRVSVTISIRRGALSRVVLERTRPLGSKKWFEEVVDLSSEPAGPAELEVRFRGTTDDFSAAGKVAVSPLLLWSRDPDSVSPLPDVVLIAIDTLRADHISAYGAPRPTPNIDALAASGTLFEQAISAASWTLPSFSSIFTSTFPWTHGVETTERALPNSLTTLGEVFAANGYRTLGFHSSGYVRPIFGFNRGFDEYTQSYGLQRFKRRVAPSLKGMAGVPLLLFVHTYDAHDPYTSVPDDYHDLYTDPDYEDTKNLSGRLFSRLNEELILEEQDFQFIRDEYDGGVRFVDDFLPTMFRLLDANRPGRPRIVVFFSDHGESFGEHDNVGHGAGPRAELTRVPLIFAGSGIPSGRRVKEVSQTLDILPTLVDLLGLDGAPQEQMQGRSLAAKFSDDPPPMNPRSVALSGHHGEFAIRTDAWSLLLDGETTELYHRKNDPLELKDVADDHPDVVERLGAELERRTVSHLASESNDVILDEATLEGLRALGYID